MAEAGYEETRHNEWVEKIRAKNLSIDGVIENLCELYAALYGVTPYKINCGMCEDFANDVQDLVPGAEGFWGDELTEPYEDFYQYGYHHIIRYNGKYYDSQHPQGVDDFRNISAFLPLKETSH